MRLVVSGYYGHGNTGDEAILAGLLRALRSTDPAIAVTVVSGSPDETARTHGVEAVPRMRPAAVWRSIRAADGLLSGGGGLLQDRTSARPVAYYAGVMGIASAARRPYVIHAQGLGPITCAANRRIAAAALRGAAHVSLRDRASIRLARSMGVRRPIEIGADPALVLDPGRGDAGHVLLAVRSWGASAEALRAIRGAVRDLARSHRVVALPMHEPMDREASVAVVDGVAGATVAPTGLSLDERLALVGDATLVVAMRLHALILAVAAGVPSVAVSYDPKVEAFAEQAGIPVAGSVDLPPQPAEIAALAGRQLATDPGLRRARAEELRAAALDAVVASLDALRRPKQ